MEKQEEKENENTTSCSKKKKTGEKGTGGARVVGGGSLFGDRCGCLIVLNKGTFIFVPRPVTASGNSSVS